METPLTLEHLERRSLAPNAKSKIPNIGAKYGESSVNNKRSPSPKKNLIPQSLLMYNQGSKLILQDVIGRKLPPTSPSPPLPRSPISTSSYLQPHSSLHSATPVILSPPLYSSHTASIHAMLPSLPPHVTPAAKVEFYLNFLDCDQHEVRHHALEEIRRLIPQTPHIRTLCVQKLSYALSIYASQRISFLHLLLETLTYLGEDAEPTLPLLGQILAHPQTTHSHPFVHHALIRCMLSIGQSGLSARYDNNVRYEDKSDKTN